MANRNAKKEEVSGVSGSFIGLPGIFITACESAGGTVILHAETETKPDKCPECGSSTLWRHGATTVTIPHTPMNGHPCKIVLTRVRWRCPVCGYCNQVGMPECATEKGYTTHLIEFLNDACLSRKLRELEKEVGISDSSLQRYAVDRIRELDKKYRFPLACKIGLDEVKIGGDYRTTITNLDKRTLIELRPARQGEHLIDYFKREFQEEERKKVLWICTDMWRSFSKHLAPLFPNAKWVVDKWHVQKEANLALEDVRKSIADELPTIDAKKKLKKQLRWCLLLRPSDPKLSQRDRTWLQADLAVVKTFLPRLWTAYGLKEAFFNIYDEHGTRDEAEKAFKAWEASIPADSLFDNFRTLAKTVRRNHEAIFNYWDSGSLTNAFTECENNLVRATDRAGRGYSFEVLRGRVLYNKRALEAAELRGIVYGPSLEILREEMAPGTRSGSIDQVEGVSDNDENPMIIEETNNSEGN